MRFRAADHRGSLFFHKLSTLNAAVLAPSGAHPSTGSLTPRTWRHILSTRLARLTGEQIGQACRVEHTQASRIASGQRGATINEWCALLDLMGLKIVDTGKLCVSREQFEFMRQTTARAIANADIARTLFEDPE